MRQDLQRLKQEDKADVYKNGVLAGCLDRTDQRVTVFTYSADYLAGDGPAVATSLPLSPEPVRSPDGTLPAFFAGLLPEGHRLTVLRNAIKTSMDDEMSMLLAVGADVPGDVQVVPEGKPPVEPESVVTSANLSDLDFASIVEAVDLHGIPGVQNKVSAKMLTSPLSVHGGRYILKLDSPDAEHLVQNEHVHLQAARALKIPVASSQVVLDRHTTPGLLVERFDRQMQSDGSWARLALEDATQVLGLPPASKYRVTTEEVVLALSELTDAPVVARRNLFLQFLFAWLTGNGDLHAKNVSILQAGDGQRVIAPLYDVPSTVLYGDMTMALTVSGRSQNLRERHWRELASELQLPERAATSAMRTALSAASRIDLASLPFTGSVLNHAQRELRHRRTELDV